MRKEVTHDTKQLQDGLEKDVCRHPELISGSRRQQSTDTRTRTSSEVQHADTGQDPQKRNERLAEVAAQRAIESQKMKFRTLFEGESVPESPAVGETKKVETHNTRPQERNRGCTKHGI